MKINHLNFWIGRLLNWSQIAIELLRLSNHRRLFKKKIKYFYHYLYDSKWIMQILIEIEIFIELVSPYKIHYLLWFFFNWIPYGWEFLWTSTYLTIRLLRAGVFKVQHDLQKLRVIKNNKSPNKQQITFKIIVVKVSST